MYVIKQLPSGQWAKVRQDTGKVVSRHATRAKAVGSIFSELTVGTPRSAGKDAAPDTGSKEPAEE